MNSKIEQLDKVLGSIADSLSWKVVMSYDGQGNLIGIAMGKHDYLYDTTGVRFTDAVRPALRVITGEDAPSE